MKKWHLEGVLSRVAPQKLVLPDLDQTVRFRRTAFSGIQKESRMISCCRSIVAFFIRFF